MMLHNKPHDYFGVHAEAYRGGGRKWLRRR